MAFKLNSLKSLFGKLAPHADDVAEWAAKHGEDVGSLPPNLKLAIRNRELLPADSKQLLDAGLSPGFSKNGRDVVSFETGDLGIDGKLFHYPTEYTSHSDVTKSQIMDNYLGPWEYREGVDVAHLGKADDFINYDNRTIYEFEPDSVQVPHQPTEQLVYRDGVLRPHKNTALGRWYEAQAKKKGIQNPYSRIGSDPIVTLPDAYDIGLDLGIPF